MNGDALKSGLSSSEGQLAGALTALLTLHDKMGLELNALTMESLTALGVAYIAGRTALKIVAAIVAVRSKKEAEGEGA